jgi:hypothetical protein
VCRLLTLAASRFNTPILCSGTGCSGIASDQSGAERGAPDLGNYAADATSAGSIVAICPYCYASWVMLLSSPSRGVAGS